MVGNSSQNDILSPQGITMGDTNLDKNKPNNKVGHSDATTQDRDIKPLLNGAHHSNTPIDIGKKPVQSYPKIQPAIAIKPKPTPIAVMPKPLNMNSRKSTFNPNVNLSNHSETTLNINTSKKWVLPPRPRPGRKPTSIMAEEDKSPDINTHPTNIGFNKDSPKKKMKTTCSIKREPQYDLSKIKSVGNQGHDDPAMGGYIEEKSSINSRRNCSISYSNEPKIDISKLPTNPIKEENKEDMDLKLAYLSQLKEQELIRNYIEVLSNQIKELKFVQNGVITFDALNSDNANQKPIKQIPAIKKPPTSEQLENINNINDLNKFISYLSKSSNIIHSVTKKFLGNDNLGPTECYNINSQIKRYLEIRSKYKLSKMEEIRKIDKSRQEIKGNIKNNIGLMKNGDDAGLIKTKSLEPGLVSLANFNNALPSSFTPGLLQNINSANLFESDDDLIDILNHEHIQNEGTVYDINTVDKLLQDESSVPEIDILNSDTASELSKDPSLNSNISVRPKVKSKANCGFCSNNTPCLCLDADLEINKLMNS